MKPRYRPELSDDHKDRIEAIRQSYGQKGLVTPTAQQIHNQALEAGLSAIEKGATQ